MISVNSYLNACGKGDFVTINDFIDNGNSVDSISLSGNSGLRNACVVDRADVVEYLLEKGSNPNLELWIKSRVNDVYICEKGVALFYARSISVVEVLKAYGADMSMQDHYGKNVVEWWKTLGRDREFICSYF